MDDKKQSKSQNVTIFDIAREAGVSYSTVSRVLNGFEPLKKSTRKKVMEAAERLGYVANPQARSLAGGRTNIIGILVPGLDTGYGYIGEMIRDVDRELELAGYDFMMFSTRRHVGKEASYVKTIASRMTDGLILITPLVPSEYLDALRERKFPYVLLDQGDKSGNSSIVESANRQGAYEATSHLIGLGHRRIAFITGLMEIESAVKRLAGYKAALAEHDISFSEELVVSGDFSYTGGYKASQELLCLNIPPTAILASNDFEALGAMEAIRDKGLQIPDDISIIGFDDIRLASISFPKLSTVRQELSQMGKMAAQLLLEQIESPDLVPRRITISTKLILRDSCAAIS